MLFNWGWYRNRSGQEEDGAEETEGVVYYCCTSRISDTTLRYFLKPAVDDYVSLRGTAEFNCGEVVTAIQTLIERCIDSIIKESGRKKIDIQLVVHSDDIADFNRAIDRLTTGKNITISVQADTEEFGTCAELLVKNTYGIDSENYRAFVRSRSLNILQNLGV